MQTARARAGGGGGGGQINVWGGEGLFQCPPPTLAGALRARLPKKGPPFSLSKGGLFGIALSAPFSAVVDQSTLTRRRRSTQNPIPSTSCPCGQPQQRTVTKARRKEPTSANPHPKKLGGPFPDKNVDHHPGAGGGGGGRRWRSEGGCSHTTTGECLPGARPARCLCIPYHGSSPKCILTKGSPPRRP